MCGMFSICVRCVSSSAVLSAVPMCLLYIACTLCALCVLQFYTQGLIITARNYLDVYPYEQWNAKVRMAV